MVSASNFTSAAVNTARSVSPININLKNMRYCPMVYLGEVGKFRDYRSNIIPLHKSQIDVMLHRPDLEIYKFGQSINVHRRIVSEHQRMFKYFDLKLLRECHRHQEVERIIQKELFAKNLLLRLSQYNRIHREIMFFENADQKLWYKQMVDDLVNTRLQQTEFVHIDLM